MEFIGKYELASEIAEKLNLNKTRIRSVIRGETKTHKGFIFRNGDE